MPNLSKRAAAFSRPYRVTKGKGFRLGDVDPSDTAHLESGDESRAREVLKEGIELLAELQNRLYAQDRWSLLLIFQAMDAAGKDGTIKHVMSGVNPQGVQVFSFKGPSAEDLDHDYLWRCIRCLPERGRVLGARDGDGEAAGAQRAFAKRCRPDDSTPGQPPHHHGHRRPAGPGLRQGHHQY